MSKKIEFKLTPSPKESNADSWVKNRFESLFTALEAKEEAKEEVRHATLRIPVDLYKKIKLKAAQDDVTVRDLVLKIFYRGLKDFF